MINKPFKTDIAVALIFFNRPECLRQTFGAIASARPSRLYLIQDGARDNKPSDEAKVEECRQIVENINWECEVHKLYSPTNLGCGMRVYSGISEVFKTEEMLVIIEDDIVIGESFLPFCKEILDRYADDERIGMISGMNHLGVYEDCPYDYFFSSQGGAIWGWATWRRVWEKIDWSLECADDKYVIKIIDRALHNNMYAHQVKINLIKKRRLYIEGIKQTSWSFQFGFTACIAQHRLNIIPKVNLISNIGNSAESVHTSKSYLIPRKLRCVYNAQTYPMPAKLNYPSSVIDDMDYAKEQAKIMGMSLWRQKFRMIESLIYRICPPLGKI